MLSVSRVLKLELLLLFFFTVLSVYAFYDQGVISDNFLTISSQTESSNLLSYYFASVVSLIGYFVGPWIFFSFFIFAAFYTFNFSKRNSFIDALNIFNLLLGSLFLTSYFYPSLLGEGIFFLLSENFPPIACLAVGVIGSLCFIMGSFRGTLKENWNSISGLIVKGAKITFWGLTKVTAFCRQLSCRGLLNKGRVNLQTRVPSILQGQDKTPAVEQRKFTNENFSIGAAKKVDQGSEVTQKPKRTTGVQQELRDHSQRNFDEQYHSLVSFGSSTKKAGVENGPDKKYFTDIINRVEGKLAEFKIEGNIINILKGPVVDTFELELGTGVKVSKVLNAEKDLSIALLGAPIRIVYPMIGRHTMGIEVPRNPREYILLDEVLGTECFRSTQTKIPIAMGKDAYGEPFVVDLATMPHMLVAGATGAGKSVFINTLLVSILVKKSPSQLKLILIDPKQLELALYSKLPHLVMPVITDAKRSSIALLWACEEMERRYTILKELGVRNIDGFNEKIKRATPEMIAAIHPFYEHDTKEQYELPYLVIIVDEFADLILTKSGKEIETNICRLAAKARAAGIHLILATQRPSVDVITGLIKSNFPTRVAFRVTSPVDSRTILTTTGAEKLLGKGDMLYRNGTENKRVHASYVDEEEIEVLTAKLCEIPQVFHESAIEFLDNGGDRLSDDPYGAGSHGPSMKMAGSFGGNEDQELYQRAVQTVIEHRTASASMLQRRLRIGYNRAANLIEEMEARGVVGPAEGSKRRKVLISSESL